MKRFGREHKARQQLCGEQADVSRNVRKLTKSTTQQHISWVLEVWMVGGMKEERGREREGERERERDRERER